MIAAQEAWFPAPEHLVIEDGAVHIWRADLNQESELVMTLRNKLTSDERNRGDKFYFENDRIHFIVARGVLREILSYYLGILPQNVELSYGPFGKPQLRGQAGKHLCFNVSHSHGLALFAITNNREIGVDLELIREESASLAIADHFFSPQEILALRKLPRELQSTAFFNCWTRKEAYIKARGVGIPYCMDGFTVSPGPGGTCGLSSKRRRSEGSG